MAEHGRDEQPRERELDIPLALTEQLANLKRRVTHLETLESASAVVPRLPRFAQENIPWLISQWPLQGNARDMAGVNSNHLTVVGATTAQTDEFAYYVFDGAGDRLEDQDNSSYPTADMSAQGWAYFINAAGSVEAIMAKFRRGSDSHRSFMIKRLADGTINFEISPSGSSGTIIDVTSTSAPGQGLWFFWAVKFLTSTQMDIFLGINGAALEQDSNTTSIPSEIHDGAANFILGQSQSSSSGYENDMTGRQTRAALHNGLIADASITILYNQGLEYLGI